MKTSRDMQRNNYMSFLATIMLSNLLLIAYSAYGVTASTQAQKLSSLLTPAKQFNNNIINPKQLRTRYLQNDAAEEPSDTNDDGYTIVDMKSIAIQMSGLSSSAIEKLQDEDVVIEIMKYVNSVGYDALMNSNMFSDRLFELNVGMEYDWSSVEDTTQTTVVAEARSNTKPWGRNLRAADKQHRVLQTFTLDTTAATQTSDSNTHNSNTATLILGQNGTITFHGSYWEDDPTSTDVTSFLVTELNKDETKMGLVNVIKPLVCTTDEIEAVDGEAGEKRGCDLNVEIVSSDALENGVVDVSEETNTEEEATPEVSEPEVADKTEEHDIATEPIQTNTVNGVEESTPSDRSAAENNGGTESNSKWLIPVIAGSTLVALAIASLLFIKLRNTHDREGQNSTEKLKTTNTDDETEYRGDMGVEVTHEDWTNCTDGVLPPASWASKAYEAITSPTAFTRNISSPSVTNRPKASAAAAAAVAGTAALEAERKKSSSDNTLNLDDKAKKKTRNIDSILDDFSDGGSSFDDSSATSNSVNTSTISGISGLSGILEEGSVPLDDLRTGSRLSNPSTDDVNSGYANAGGGYLPKSLTKDLKTRSNVSNTSSTIRKQEEFEGAYRTRSAMAKLNLKKDILHVACDTHDSPTEAVDSEAATGGPSVPIIGSSAVAAGACGFGVTRTISAKKNSTLLEKQRIAEKLTMKSYGKKSRKRAGRNEDEEDSILPLNFVHSDSVISEEEDSI